MSILIKNGFVVMPDGVERADILTDGNKIARIAPELDEDLASKVIDAKGKYVMAGFVDMHCHLRDPGLEYKEDINSGTKAALQGGFTSIACMPNTNPVIDNKAIVKYVKDKGAEVDNAKLYVIGAMTKGLKGEELSEIGSMAAEGIVAVSDDGCPVSDGAMMKRVIEYASSFDVLPISHSEDKTISGDGVVNEGLNASIAGLKGISRVAEEAAIAREILLAESLNSRIHIAHVSTRNSVELIRNAKARGVKVTAETCPHYFSATDEEILSYNTNAKINPPLRTPDDIEAIIAGLEDGTIDAIATDHAPHHFNEKNQEFNFAPFGTSGFETAFALGYTNLVLEDRIDLVKLSKLMSANPSKILRLGSGELKAGEKADIAIVDLDVKFTVDPNKFVSKGKNSVFSGWTLNGIVTNVIVDGIEKTLKLHTDN